MLILLEEDRRGLNDVYLALDSFFFLGGQVIQDAGDDGKQFEGTAEGEGGVYLATGLDALGAGVSGLIFDL